MFINALFSPWLLVERNFSAKLSIMVSISRAIGKQRDAVCKSVWVEWWALKGMSANDSWAVQKTIVAPTRPSRNFDMLPSGIATEYFSKSTKARSSHPKFFSQSDSFMSGRIEAMWRKCCCS